MKSTADAFGKYEITVCLEPLAPCYCNFVNTLEEAAEIVKEIGWKEIRLIADYYNLEYVNEADKDMSRSFRSCTMYICQMTMEDREGALI